jgi:hypothetical protein
VCYIIAKIFYSNGYNHGYIDGSINTDYDYKKRWKLKTNDFFSNKEILFTEYGAKCSICNKEFNYPYINGNKISFTSDKNQIEKHLKEYGWSVLNTINFVLCPICNERFKLMDLKIKWDNEEISFSDFEKFRK